MAVDVCNLIFSSLQEKGVLCAIIGVGVCAYPAWILSNIKNYRGAADE